MSAASTDYKFDVSVGHVVSSMAACKQIWT